MNTTKNKSKIKCKPRKGWKLGSAYLLPKNKDTNRFRPVVSYFHFHSKPWAKKIGRALTVAIKELVKSWTTMEMPNAKDLIKTILQTRKDKKWKEAALKNSITFLHFDIKNQFLNLSKKRVRLALETTLTHLRRTRAVRKLGFAIRRRSYEKHLDRIGHANKLHETGVTMTEILRYADFELKYPLFQVGKKIVMQRHGLPMGGFLSAHLACIDAMTQEHYFQSL